ncbi:hypothetical protein [Brevibacterium sp. RIT 803]|uniref:hypothetical protein n=1 Tax=Brevibacterium sp. RIT 803 TaxID=2810210 RepID=UPI0019505403|nr:hypothetical protein [Brevibacterium sp. RIT 803]MBM6588920.1 hypothetical protein [Brevibacterium sp. RIT 803]
MSEQNINVNVERGAGPDNHAWTVLGTLLACGAVGMAAWAISNAGMLDMAATGLSFFFIQLITMMMKAGLLVVPEKHSTDFSESRGIIKTLWREFQEFQGNSPIWRMALLALGFTLAYLIFRFGLSVALGVFENIWIAGAASALIASFIVSPQLFKTMFSKMKTRSGVQIKSTPAEPEAWEGGVA